MIHFRDSLFYLQVVHWAILKHVTFQTMEQFLGDLRWNVLIFSILFSILNYLAKANIPNKKYKKQILPCGKFCYILNGFNTVQKLKQKHNKK